MEKRDYSNWREKVMNIWTRRVTQIKNKKKLKDVINATIMMMSNEWCSLSTTDLVKNNLSNWSGGLIQRNDEKQNLKQCCGRRKNDKGTGKKMKRMPRFDTMGSVITPEKVQDEIHGAHGEGHANEDN